MQIATWRGFQRKNAPNAVPVLDFAFNAIREVKTAVIPDCDQRKSLWGAGETALCSYKRA